MADAAFRGTDRLSVFAFLWAAATISHHLAFPWWFDRHTWLNAALVATAILLLVRPRSIVIFAALAGLAFVNVVKLAPEHPNHMLFEGFGDVVIVAAILLRIGARGAVGRVDLPPAERQQLFDTMAPPIRVGLLVLYGFAVLHKLNWDFFNADVSCAPTLVNDILSRHSLPSLPGGARSASVWVSLFIESAVPVGLAFRRSRSAAVALALFFHLLLAQHGVTGLYSFSATMLAVLFLFTPREFTDYIGGVVDTAGAAIRSRPVAAAGVGTSVLALAILAVVAGGEWRRLLWNLWALLAVGLYGQWAWGYRRPFEVEGIFAVRPAVLWVFPLLLVVNGSSPYLGLKTHTSFSMFSNLRTEGGRTNHMFLGRLSLGTWQEDLVEILDSDLPAFQQAREDDLLLTYFSFRGMAGTAGQDFAATYRRQGEVRVLTVRDGIASEAEAATAPPWWQRKVLYFRGVDREGPTRCWN